MTLTLAIDTAADVRAGLARDGVPLSRAVVADRRAHAEQLLPLVQQLLAEADATPSDLTEIVVGVGPGPFTGLRVGVVTAQTLGFALGVPVRGVCSLDVGAVGYAGHADAAGEYLADAAGEFLVVSDARRKEVYWARYGADASRLTGPFVGPAAELPDLPVTGPGAELAGGRSTPLDGGLLALAGPDLPDVGLSPLYLRRPDAEVPTTRKSTLLQPRLAPGLKR